MREYNTRIQINPAGWVQNCNTGQYSKPDKLGSLNQLGALSEKEAGYYFVAQKGHAFFVLSRYVTLGEGVTNEQQQ